MMTFVRFFLFGLVEIWGPFFLLNQLRYLSAAELECSERN